MRRTGWVIAVFGCCLLVGALVIQAMAQDAVVTQARPGIQAKMLTDQDMDQISAGTNPNPWAPLNDFWSGMLLVGADVKWVDNNGNTVVNPVTGCNKGCTSNSINMVANPNYCSAANGCPTPNPKKIQSPSIQAGVNAMVQAGIALCKGPLGCK